MMAVASLTVAHPSNARSVARTRCRQISKAQGISQRAVTSASSATGSAKRVVVSGLAGKVVPARSAHSIAGPFRARTDSLNSFRCAADASATVPAPEPADAPDTISENDAVANVAKSIMGAGCFALPWAYAQTGLAFTSAYMVAASLLCLYCVRMMTLAKSATLEVNPAAKPAFGSYAGYASETISPLGGKLADLLVLSCCFGISSAYLVFVASSLSTIVPTISQNTFVTYITPVMVMLSWLKKFSNVSLISLFGNISVLVGLAMVTSFGMGLPAQWGAIPLMNVAAFPQAFGTVAFLFFVHFTMPPVESSMAEPELFPRACAKAFGLSTLVGATFGTIGAAYFGPDVSSVIISMLSGSFLVTAVKLLLCVNLLCTFPLICRGAFDIIEKYLGGAENLSAPVSYGMRSSFVVLAALCAVFIPSFGRLLGLVGGVSCTVLTMIFPPLMYYCSYKLAKKEIGLLDQIGCLVVFIGGWFMAGSALMG